MLLVAGVGSSHSLAAQKKPKPGANGKVITTKDGLKIEVLAEGSGPGAKPGQTVSVHYTGWLTNGKKFDSSRDRGQPITFPLGRHQVIAGWDEGLIGMKKGGHRKLTIPPKLGYGESGTPDGSIPPNSTLIFDVEMMDIR
jgi:FKBP-type peptidyl-prolyl cis-trans isomerase